MEEQSMVPEETVPFLQFSSIVVFAAHPGDEAIGCGGLLALCRNHGIQVHVIFVSSGKSAEHNEHQCRTACSLLGIESIAFWRESFGRIDYTEALIEKARQIILEAAVDCILAPSTRETHSDRCATAWIAIEAARRSLSHTPSLSVALYEIEASLTNGLTLLDVSAGKAQKCAAIACHGEQGHDDTSRPIPQSARDETAFEAFRILDGNALLQPVLIDRPALASSSLTDSPAQYGKVAVLIRSIGRDSLQRTLDSIALQTWPSIEIVLLNAKGPGHPEASNYSGRIPLRFIDSDRPLSRTEAANHLLESAEADYALFLDDDDWLAPDHIGHLADRLEQTPDALAVYAGVEYGQMINGRWQAEHIYNAAFDPCRLLFENFLPIHAVLFRLEAVRNRAGCRFDTGLDVFEDWDFWLQINEHGSILATGHVSAFYLFNEQDGSGTHPTAERQASIEKLRRKWLKRLSEDRLLELFDYLQQTYRNACLKQQFIEQQERENQCLSETLEARNTEIADYQTALCDLRTTLASREIEIARTITKSNTPTQGERFLALMGRL